jgi:hypothetical protein
MSYYIGPYDQSLDQRLFMGNFPRWSLWVGLWKSGNSSGSFVDSQTRGFLSQLPTTYVVLVRPEL